jgi:hypothetical protein
VLIPVIAHYLLGGGILSHCLNKLPKQAFSLLPVLFFRLGRSKEVQMLTRKLGGIILIP